MENHSSWTKLPSQKYEDYSSAIEAGILIEKKSKQYLIEQEYEKEWNIGVPAAIFHFSLLDRNFENLKYNRTVQEEKKKNIPSPPLYKKNSVKKPNLKLTRPKNHPLYKTMKQRRSERDIQDGYTSLDTLSDILYCGLGITGHVEGDVGQLPLKMTPSAGARNPYEAYIFARNVDGLNQGVYHYSASEHNLAKIAPLPKESLSSYVGNQDWVDNKNALIFLVAYMERSMWKYEDPNIYRAIMIEAGHIAQNMMLVATKDNQTLCPTAALSHTKVMDAAGINKKITRSPIYALALGPKSR